MGQRHDLPEVAVIDEDGEDDRDRAGRTRAGPVRGAGGDRRAAGARGAAGEGEPTTSTRSALPALRHGGRAARLHAVVREDRAAGRGAIRVVEEGQVAFLPERWTKIYCDWMDNIHDWCISRQLWWGHRIPVWYCDGVRRDGRAPSRRPSGAKCGGALRAGRRRARHLVQLAALAVLTLGWPDADDGPGAVLPDRRAGDGVRHHLLLGRADDHGRR